MSPAEIGTIVFLVLLLSGAGVLVYLGVKKDKREKLFFKNKEIEKVELDQEAEKRLVTEYRNLFAITFAEIKKCHSKTSEKSMSEINNKTLEKLADIEKLEDFQIVKTMEKSQLDFEFIEKLKLNNASSWKTKFTKEFKNFH